MKKLTFDQLKSASEMALKNARGLIKDAELLFRNRSWPRVVFLSQIAGEEIGKYLYLSSASFSISAGLRIDWKKTKKILKSHCEKQKVITYMEDILLDQPFPDDIHDYFDHLQQQVNELEISKQKSLYSDFTQGIAHTPNDFISEEIATNALKWAKGRINLFTMIEEKIKSNKISIEKVKNLQKKFEIKQNDM